MPLFPTFEHVALETDWQFFTKYLALSRDQQEQLHQIVDAIIRNWPVLPE